MTDDEKDRLGMARYHEAETAVEAHHIDEATDADLLAPPGEPFDPAPEAAADDSNIELVKKTLATSHFEEGWRACQKHWQDHIAQAASAAPGRVAQLLRGISAAVSRSCPDNE